MTTVLLTDGQQRKTLAAARSLARAGHRVLVADETRLSLTRFSRACAAGLVSPPPASAAYRPWLAAAAARVDVVVPMDDLSTEAAIALGPALGASALLPTARQFAAGRDKLETVALARRAGIAHPRTLEAATAEAVGRGLERLGGRAVLRPRVGAGGRGLRFLGEGRDRVPRANPGEGYLLQERVPLGRKFDVGLLYDRGGVLRAHFVQEELRWFPREHGASTLQRPVVRPDLVARAEALIAPIGWTGPVEAEFMLDGRGEPLLLELNPRLWASLGLAVAAGVDFPRLIVDLALDRPVLPQTGYRTDLLCRWSLPADTLHFLTHPLRRLAPDAPRRLPGEQLVDDILSWHDPGPAVGFALAALRYSLDLGKWRELWRL